MKVLHLGKYYPPARGGIETHVQTLARAQRRLGMDVHVLCFQHAAGGRDFTGRKLARTRTAIDRDSGVEVHRLGRVLQLSGTDLAPRMFSEVAKGTLRKYDVVHLHTPNPAMLAACALEPSIRTLVVTHHSDIVRQKKLAKIHEPLEEHVYRRADLILSDSPGYIEGSRVLERHLQKVQVLPLGLELSGFHRSESAQRSAEEEPLWLFVGRLVYYKGLEVAVRALGHVPGRLAVVGRGPEEGPAKALAEAVGVSDRIDWLGSAGDDELRGLYRRATALWFPSTERSEGFGLVQVEAMASGCPVINTAVSGSGVSWVSSHDESGLTVPVGDPSALAAAANRLLSEPALRERLSRGAVERAARMFSADVMAEASRRLYAQAARA